MVSLTDWTKEGQDIGLAIDLERIARREKHELGEQRQMIVCSFCGQPALTWTPLFGACDECLESQEALD